MDSVAKQCTECGEGGHYGEGPICAKCWRLTLRSHGWLGGTMRGPRDMEAAAEMDRRRANKTQTGEG